MIKVLWQYFFRLFLLFVRTNTACSGFKKYLILKTKYYFIRIPILFFFSSSFF